MASTFKQELYGGRESDHPFVGLYTVDASATFAAGDIVFKGSGDDVEACATDATVVLGMALASAALKANYPNSRIPVAVFDERTLVKMASTTTPADAHVGVEYEVTVASGVMKVDTGATSTKGVIVVDYGPKSGSVGPEHFIVRFRAAILQGVSIDS